MVAVIVKQWLNEINFGVEPALRTYVQLKLKPTWPDHQSLRPPTPPNDSMAMLQARHSPYEYLPISQ